ncbi:MAG: hypothetical protein H0U73_09275 [Tatlockia sp.]|nr:hypothetical protein [Tatlockia sp.]
MYSLGTGIFWTALFSVFATLFLSTLIGRAWCAVFPYKSRATALFYLSPILGLASFTIIATLVGKILPLGGMHIVPCITAALLLGVILRERQLKQAIYQASWVGLYGIVCGLTILIPLFTFGALNTHNDSFLYLAHSNWLQEHAFNYKISNEEITPLNTAILIFQNQGLRMGASFLLAFFQALFKLNWSYDLYPAIIISVITACCLALGFPLAKVLSPLKRKYRLALLALTAFNIGGLFYGATNGFFSQTVGLSLGASLLFVTGPLFYWIATAKPNTLAILKATIPSILLFVSLTFAYSELDPFLGLGIVTSAFIIAFRSHAWKGMLSCLSFLFGISAILLNVELIRVYKSLSMESHAVVGTPVEWNLIGFIGHIFGVHSGQGEVFQWAMPSLMGTNYATWGLVFLAALFSMLLIEWRSVWRAINQGILMPAAMVLFIFLAGLVYFRYFVPSPFDRGTGQSWSQFKLSDWANPCLMALVLFAIAGFHRRFRKGFRILMPSLFVIFMVFTVYLSMVRSDILMTYNYYGIRNLEKLYLTIRKEVLAHCPLNSPIYLSLKDDHHKFRQMMAYFLYDREIKGDWAEDVYIYTVLPLEKRNQKSSPGDCVIEPMDGHLAHNGVGVGGYRIGMNEG